MEDVAKAGLNDRSGVGDGHRNGDGEPSKGVSDAIGLGAPDPCAIAPVRVEGGANVPTIDTMGCPSLAAVWFFVDEDSNARWGNGGAVEVKLPMNLGPGRKVGVDAGTS